jgi:hypothetical protein
MNYKKLKNLYRLVFYGRNDLNRNQDGTATNSSLTQTNQTRLLTPYITNYISNSYNSKIMRFSLNNCFNNVSLAENSYLYLNTYTLPIINNGDRQYFTNLKLLGAGSDKDYNNLSFDNPIIATNFHTGTIAYNPELTPSISSNITIVSEELLDLDEGIYDVYYTNRTLTTTIVEKGLTTIRTENQLLECVNPPDADYFIMDDVDLNVNTSGNVLNSTKIYGYNDFYYQLTTNDLKVNILPQNSLKCDVLLVGAGGNGGSNYTINGSNYYGGGGGAGELVYIKDLDVNETDLISIMKNTNETTMTHFKDGSIMTYTAKRGGNGGSFDGTNSILPTSGGSGGGGMYLTYSGTTTVESVLEYPPKAFNTFTAQTSNNSFLGFNDIYKETITLTTADITYGSGTYEIYASSIFDFNNYQKRFLFNKINDSVGGHWSSNYTNGVYNGTKYIKSDYTGDWIVLKLPESISLSGFLFSGRNSFISQAPGTWKCYGSLDGVNFVEIPDAGNSTRLTSSSYTGTDLNYRKDFTSFTPFYTYIGFVFKSVVGTGTSDIYLCFDELRLYGNKYQIATTNVYYNGANAGTPYNNNGYIGDVNNGNNGASLKAGNGGSATTSNINITGSNIIYGLGGTGASLNSTPASKVGLYGYGGDGNGGIGGDGIIIIRFKDLGSVNTTNITTQYIEQPYSITYTNDFINYDKTKLNSVKLPKNFLNKNYVDFEINTLLSGGSNLTFDKEQLDRLIIDASIIEIDNEISNNIN